jgi:hypothetical protein
MHWFWQYSKCIGRHFGRFFRKPVWGQCYDHNFRRFLTIFGEKIGVFLKKPMLWLKFCIILLCFESKTPIFFSENILKIITSVPGHPASSSACSLSVQRRSNCLFALLSHLSKGQSLIILFSTRVARFLWVRDTKTGKMYQINIKPNKYP